MRAQEGSYEASNFNRVVACSGPVNGLCEAEDCHDAYASAVVPGPRTEGASADTKDPRDQDEAAEVASTSSGNRRF